MGMVWGVPFQVELLNDFDTYFEMDGNPEIVKELMARYPRVFQRIMSLFQTGRLESHKYIALPKKRGRLLFEKEAGKVHIVFIPPKDDRFTEKFKEALDEVVLEIEHAPMREKEKRRSLIQYSLSQKVIEEIALSIEELY